jgi:hypothetical protein
MPAVKDRARSALPRLIRERLEKIGDVPFPALVIGAERYLSIETSGDSATVRPRTGDRAFELRMVRAGDRWKVVAVRDSALAAEISRKLGQEIIAIALDPENVGPNRLGVGNLSDLLRSAQEILQ